MNLTSQLMEKALHKLSEKISRPTRIIIGGGGAMLLAHQFPLATTDIDGIPAEGLSIDQLDSLVKQVAKELNLPSDWLNPFYVTFTHVLPSDYGSRLIRVFNFSPLVIEALSKEDL